jgi:hypothetical protein
MKRFIKLIIIFFVALQGNPMCGGGKSSLPEEWMKWLAQGESSGEAPAFREDEISANTRRAKQRMVNAAQEAGRLLWMETVSNKVLSYDPSEPSKGELELRIFYPFSPNLASRIPELVNKALRQNSSAIESARQYYSFSRDLKEIEAAKVMRLSEWKNSWEKQPSRDLERAIMGYLTVLINFNDYDNDRILRTKAPEEMKSGTFYDELYAAIINPRGEGQKLLRTQIFGDPIEKDRLKEGSGYSLDLDTMGDIKGTYIPVVWQRWREAKQLQKRGVETSFNADQLLPQSELARFIIEGLDRDRIVETAYTTMSYADNPFLNVSDTAPIIRFESTLGYSVKDHAYVIVHGETRTIIKDYTNPAENAAMISTVNGSLNVWQDFYFSDSLTRGFYYLLYNTQDVCDEPHKVTLVYFDPVEHFAQMIQEVEIPGLEWEECPRLIDLHPVLQPLRPKLLKPTRASEKLINDKCREIWNR